MAQELPSNAPDPEAASRAVFRIIEQHIGADETDKVIRQLPEPVQELWQLEPEPRDS